MAKVSLCMIVGNVEEYIRRCLTSFEPIADEICVVRAIGNQKPDATLEIAEKEFGARVGEYKNKPGHEDWPHVDDFAAARQQSYDMATGDYCFWCDSDDVLESGAEFVREQTERGHVAIACPYKIFGRGISVMRERMMLKNSGKWVFAVHECFQFHISPARGDEDHRIVITHLPKPGKSVSSNDRNLRILKSIPEDEMTTGLLYHLHLELALSGDMETSLDVARKCLARPDIGKAEKYEIFLNLAQMATDPNQKSALLHQALAANPCRREALGLLSTVALNFGKEAEGLAFARQMMATPKPADLEWNERSALYGWVGDDLYAQALRANGQFNEAEVVRFNAMKKYGTPRIALLHATRGRPELASACRKVWLDSAEKPELVEHIFAYDEDDEKSQVLERFNSVVSKGGGCVNAWNLAFQKSIAPVVVQLSDDWTPQPMWDKLILDRIDDVDKPAVLAISDGQRKDDLLCMAICTRTYCEKDGFLFHPWFTGVYSDNWFTECAYKRKAVIEARDIVFEHHHPAFGSNKMDETYAKQNAPERYQEGETILSKLRARKDWSSVPGFFNYWQFYRSVARQIQDGTNVVEVGVWLGRSIIFLAQELKRLGKNKVKLYAVDHFKGESNQKEHEATVRECGGSLRSAFEENIKRCEVADMITILEGDSADMASHFQDCTLDFVYIDAAHEYEPVVRDLKAWLPKVKKDGLMAGHDYDYEPVRKAVADVIGPVKSKGCVWIK